ncbi:hypothetical protein PCYB_004370, partial [Plasmodium cynomolgi strain B]
MMTIIIPVDKNNDIINSIDSKIKVSFIYLCAMVKDYLSHSVIKRLRDVTNTCKYINYHIRKELINHKYSDKNGTFNKLKEYILFGDENKDKSCISKMEYIDDLSFNKMNDLYGLYDAYDAFCDERNRGVLNNCSTLSELIDDYNDIINENKYENSIYLYKELKNIKCLIEKLELMKLGKCRDLPILLSLKTDLREDAVHCIYQEKPVTLSQQDSGFQQVVGNQERGAEIVTIDTNMSLAGITLPLSIVMTGMFCLLLYKVNNNSI